MEVSEGVSGTGAVTEVLSVELGVSAVTSLEARFFSLARARASWISASVADDGVGMEEDEDTGVRPALSGRMRCCCCCCGCC